MNAPLTPAQAGALLHADQALQQVSAKWDNDITGQLVDYIAIPSKSPMFDPDWAARVEPVRRDADLGTHAKFTAVGKLGGSVVQDDRAVHSTQEPLCGTGQCAGSLPPHHRQCAQR